MECDGAIDTAISITWCWHWYQWYQMAKMSCCTSFESSWSKECNGTSTTPSALCDADTGAKAVTWAKQSCCTSFGLSLPKGCSGAIHVQKSHVAPYFSYFDVRNPLVPFTMPSALCDANAGTNCIAWSKLLFCISFWSKEGNGAIDDAINIMLCKCWCQWHHMTREVMLHLILT